jgi:iron complex transport system substrate-binding protein
LLFKENVGCTPNDYRLKAKCQKGIEYLLTTDKTVEEISALIGLSSASHFRRILKSQMGLTPKEVRKRSDF